MTTTPPPEPGRPTPPDWTADWDGMVALVGTDLSGGRTRWGADVVEPGTIRRYLEPLEL